MVVAGMEEKLVGGASGLLLLPQLEVLGALEHLRGWGQKQYRGPIYKILFMAVYQGKLYIEWCLVVFLMPNHILMTKVLYASQPSCWAIFWTCPCVPCCSDFLGTWLITGKHFLIWLLVCPRLPMIVVLFVVRLDWLTGDPVGLK